MQAASRRGPVLLLAVASLALAPLFGEARAQTASQITPPSFAPPSQSEATGLPPRVGPAVGSVEPRRRLDRSAGKKRDRFSRRPRR